MILAERSVKIEQSVLIAVRVHPFPSRTRQLSSLAPKILGWRRPGKIGSADTKNRQFFNCLFFFVFRRIKAFEPGRKYSESEVNEILLRFHDDYYTIHRDMIAKRLMECGGTVYRWV